MSVKQAMLEDHAFGAESIMADLRFARRYLLQLANATNIGTAIPVPGSGTYACEAVIRTFVPAGGKLLIHSNGVYGDTLVAICRATGTPHKVLRTSAVVPATADQLREALRRDPSITHVMVVHCETSSGILNPIGRIGQVCEELDKVLLIDAIATFGALNLDIARVGYQALVLSSNKCLEGPPGLAWVVANRAVLDASKGNAGSLILDLWDQNQHLERTDCFRFTPPTHLISSIAQALREHQQEGGRCARLSRYRANHQRLIRQMRALGFKTLLPDDIATPILAAFLEPEDPRYSFDKLCDGMRQRGFDIYPGPLAVQGTFRIGCIGSLTEEDMQRAVEALRDILDELGVTQRGISGTEAA
jgi:2-aminoethylphosphonate-pyruvate transaminase